MAKSKCPAVDARTAAGQKLNPPFSLFFSSFPLFLSLSVFGKWDWVKAAGENQRPRPLRIQRWLMDETIEVRSEETLFGFCFLKSFSFLSLVYQKLLKTFFFC